MTDEPNTAEVTQADIDLVDRLHWQSLSEGGLLGEVRARVAVRFHKHRLASRPDDRPTNAIEAAFRAGHAAAEETLGAHGSERLLDAIERAWSDYRADNALEALA